MAQSSIWKGNSFLTLNFIKTSNSVLRIVSLGLLELFVSGLAAKKNDSME